MEPIQILLAGIIITFALIYSAALAIRKKG
jgi:hypothetical protein